MNRHRYEIKRKAILMRQKGVSIRKIEKNLSIPRSTLSGWLREVHLTTKQKSVLKKDWKNALIKARRKAVIWHNTQKKNRLLTAQTDAQKILLNLKTEDYSILELALAMLYMGEGSKKSHSTGLGNSDPLIVKFFVDTIQKIYKLTTKDMRFDLHLRADQNLVTVKKFWSKKLGVPISKFSYVAIDQRTRGTETYKNYKGVCLITCGNVAIQRKLIYLSRGFCERAVSSVGRASD